MINQKLRKLFLPGLLFLFHTSFVFSEENLFFLYPQKGNTDTKIFVGFRGGINFTQPIPLKRYSVVSVNSLDNTGIKHYKSFLSNVGYQYGFIMTYSLTDNFAISFQPGFSQYTYNYSNSYSWTDNTNTSNQIDLTYESRHVLHYFELPVLIQYSYGSGTLKPYLQAGFQYGILQNAAARVTTNLTQRSITGDVPLNMDDNTGDSTEMHREYISMYRWFIKDPVYWKKECRVTMQQIGCCFFERKDDWSAATFWYESIPSAPLPKMPGVNERTNDLDELLSGEN